MEIKNSHSKVINYEITKLQSLQGVPRTSVDGIAVKICRNCEFFQNVFKNFAEISIQKCNSLNFKNRFLRNLFEWPRNQKGYQNHIE